MIRSILLVCLIAIPVCRAGATKHTVTAVGFAFSPATLNITEGDTVVFTISGLHNAREVSQATWNADGTAQLPGGFSVPFGGGEAVPAGVGAHYYVCTNHVLSSSMKGVINVSPAAAPEASILISSIVDRDGNLGTSSDRVGKNWSLKLYRDSVGSGVVVDSAASSPTLHADSLEAGTYVAVEADSASWTHISQTVDFVPIGPTSLNYRSIVVGEGEDHVIDFLNYAPNVVISSGFAFEPETLVVDSADTVRFVLDPMHNAREVDSLAWESDDTTSNGGFEVPYGGGELVASAPGTIRYVCVPHAVGGMKGVLVVRSPGELSLPVAEGWNLLSLPFLTPEGTVSALYPAASSAAFTYQAGYLSQAAVAPGPGFWLKFPGAQSVDLDGAAIFAETVAVSQGWNIVGSISVPIGTASVQSDPGGLVTSSFFGYDAGYFTADTLQPGRGYWVKAGGAGSLILQAPPAATPAAGGVVTVPAPEVPAARPAAPGAQPDGGRDR